MMIAAYRAARLNQRLILRAAPLPQQDHMPSATPVHGEADRPSRDPSLAVAPILATERTDQIAPPASEPVAADADRLTEAFATSEPVVEEAVHAEPFSTPAEAAQDSSPARAEPALAEIGLGPCMLLRLNQIGLRSVHDVARAKPDDLRAALGGSSRLLNVEAWISNARHLTATGTGDPNPA